MRKPHNLITSYWDDSVYFLNEAEKAFSQFKGEENEILFPSEKRGFRYAVLSSFLFLEAFINAEYVDQMNFNSSLKDLSQLQINSLDADLLRTTFEDKWSKWINTFANNTLPLKNDPVFSQLKELKDWRNHLTHYKIHRLYFVARDIENIECARKAQTIARNAVKWYFDITQFEIPEWIVRDVLKVE